MFVRLTKFLRENPGDCYIPVGNRRRLMLTRSTFTSLFLFTNNKTTAIWKCTRFMERRKYTYEYFKYSISLLYHLFSILFLSYFFYFVPFDWPQEHTIHTATQHSVLLLLLLLLFSTSRVCNFERNSDSVFIFLLLFRILLLLRRWPEFWAQIRSPRASLVSFFLLFLFLVSFCLILRCFGVYTHACARATNHNRWLSVAMPRCLVCVRIGWLLLLNRPRQVNRACAEGSRVLVQKSQNHRCCCLMRHWLLLRPRLASPQRQWMVGRFVVLLRRPPNSLSFRLQRFTIHQKFQMDEWAIL